MDYRPSSRPQLIYLLHFISGDSENKDICETEFDSSKWLNNRCYYFHNKEEISFDNAKKICSEIFKNIGFGKGRLYEPEYLEDFTKIYELAEEFSEKLSLPETQKGEFVKKNVKRQQEYANLILLQIKIKDGN